MVSYSLTKDSSFVYIHVSEAHHHGYLLFQTILDDKLLCRNPLAFCGGQLWGSKEITGRGIHTKTNKNPYQTKRNSYSYMDTAPKSTEHSEKQILNIYFLLKRMMWIDFPELYLLRIRSKL